MLTIKEDKGTCCLSVSFYSHNEVCTVARKCETQLWNQESQGWNRCLFLTRSQNDGEITTKTQKRTRNTQPQAHATPQRTHKTPRSFSALFLAMPAKLMAYLSPPPSPPQEREWWPACRRTLLMTSLHWETSKRKRWFQTCLLIRILFFLFYFLNSNLLEDDAVYKVGLYVYPTGSEREVWNWRSHGASFWTGKQDRACLLANANRLWTDSLQEVNQTCQVFQDAAICL